MSDITPIGFTNFRNDKKQFGIKDEDRLNHIYVIGKTGTGKSTLLLKSMLLKFDKRFGLLFGGKPYNHNLFVTFNVCAYFMFTLGGIGFYKNIKPLMFIAMFFIVYGIIGSFLLFSIQGSFCYTVSRIIN